jgi:alpha-tubulin suppressor-like RCC1 family protein
MPNPTTNFKNSNGTDFGNIIITKEYLMSVYPQIANQIITPELWVWGSGGFGQLGGNTITNITTPVTTFAGGANWKQVACGTVHTAAIKTDGTLWGWGRNTSGELGDNTQINRSTPVTTFAGGTNWKQVAGGGSHTAAIKTDGTLWTWGDGANGNLGDNNAANRFTPPHVRLTPITTFAGGTNWKQVACGFSNTAAIKTDGTLWNWGAGSLGINNTSSPICTPVTTFAGGTNWKQVSINNHTAAIKTDGTLWTWGQNNSGELGVNDAINRLTPVTTFAGGTNWKQAACGGFFQTAAIKTDGTLWTWGINSFGILGNNKNINIDGLYTSTPVTTFAGGTNWKQVACGSFHTVAIKTDGTLWTWGSNSGGQLGDNTTTNRSTPVTTFAGGTNWKQVSGGFDYTAAIKSTDTL